MIAADVLAEYLPKQRWFGGHGPIEIESSRLLREEWPALVQTMVRAVKPGGRKPQVTFSILFWMSGTGAERPDMVVPNTTSSQPQYRPSSMAHVASNSI